MATLKAGTILLNLQTKQVGLVYRRKNNDYSFPKGHLEQGETLKECAVRETEEETLRANHLITNEEIYTLKYTTPLEEDVECYFYLAIDDGPTNKSIAIDDIEVLEWVNPHDVENKLSYEDLKTFWNSSKNTVLTILDLK